MIPSIYSVQFPIHILAENSVVYGENKNRPLSLQICIDKENQLIYVKHSVDKQIWLDLRTISKSWWQKDKRQWIFAGNNQNYLEIKQIAKKNNCVVETELMKSIDEKELNPVVKRYVETLQMKKYRPNTIKAYLPHFKKFAEYFKDTDIENLAYDQISQYIEIELIHNDTDEKRRHLSCAIKFYYEYVLGHSKMIFYLRENRNIAEKPFILPIEMLLRLLNNLEDSRIRLMFFLKYGFNIKASKIASVSQPEIKEWFTRHVFVKYSHMKSEIVLLVKQYYKQYKPEVYLFEKTPASNFLAQEVEYIIQKAIEEHEFTEPYKNIIKELLIAAGYKDKTVKLYKGCLLHFLKYFNYRDFKTIKNEEIRGFLHTIGKSNNVSTSLINQYINALKFYYNDVLKRNIPLNMIYRPKAPKKLPKVLSPEQIEALLVSIDNIKHKCIISLEYSAGMRIGEVIGLKIEQLNFKKGEIRIFAEKGQKERITLLADSLIGMLKQYMDEYKPKEYLFEGATGGKYSQSSIQNILKTALIKAGITEKATNHWLRHSFATDLLEHGTDIRYIQDLLGHASIKTTLRYAHVQDNKRRTIVSPLDRIKLSKNINDENEDKNKKE